MHSQLITVVVSAGQSRNPEKRELEQQVGELAGKLEHVRVVRIPHLYDLPASGESYAALKEIVGDLVFCSWLYDRAAHWVLDRNGIRGQAATVELKLEEDSAEEDLEEETAATTVVDDQPRPNRNIYCIDFRASSEAEDFHNEIKRIAELPRNELPLAEELPVQPRVAPGSTLTLEALERYSNPTNDTYIGNQSPQARGDAEPAAPTLLGTSSMVTIDEHPGRRWYPVIDFSRCTNCMECIDFCLFGVYGVDSLETIVVEQADNCRKGCPACSRVCPQNAIIFPQHKTPAIAGAPVDTGGLKIDLSKLFGAPESDEDASAVAARERDEQLILAGREAVGNPTNLQERLASNSQHKSTDELDGLLDQLDSLDL